MTNLIPSRQNRPADDVIFRLARQAAERAQRGEPVVNATIGTLLDDAGRLAVLPTAAAAVRAVSAEEWAAYAPTQGSPDFLRAVVDDVFGAESPVRDTVVAAATPGGTGAIRLAITGYLEPGQSLLTTDLHWGPFRTLADEAERAVTVFPMFRDLADGGVGGFDVEALDRALEVLLALQGRALVVLNDPCQNPTGYTLSESEWRAIAEVLGHRGRRAPVTLLLDAAYSAYDPASAEPGSPSYLARVARLLAPMTEHAGLLVAWSASKSFTQYGLRVGALLAPVPDARERARTDAALGYACRGTWSTVSRGGQRAVTQLLSDADLSASVGRERAALRALLESRSETFRREALRAGLRLPRGAGGFFVSVLCDDAHARAARLRERGVFVVPQEGALRVALCSVPSHDVPRLVEALRE